MTAARTLTDDAMLVTLTRGELRAVVADAVRGRGAHGLCSWAVDGVARWV